VTAKARLKMSREGREEGEEGLTLLLVAFFAFFPRNKMYHHPNVRTPFFPSEDFPR
jgi:hypothetical protein